MKLQLDAKQKVLMIGIFFLILIYYMKQKEIQRNLKKFKQFLSHIKHILTF